MPKLWENKKTSQILAGFALETDNEIENAKAKLKRKNLDLIVLNSLQEEGAGFGYDTNRITIIDRNNNIDKFELKSKEEAARDILDKIVSMINKLIRMKLFESLKYYLLIILLHCRGLFIHRN